jgi:hypothetical protein
MREGGTFLVTPNHVRKGKVPHPVEFILREGKITRERVCKAGERNPSAVIGSTSVHGHDFLRPLPAMSASLR